MSQNCKAFFRVVYFKLHKNIYVSFTKDVIEKDLELNIFLFSFIFVAEYVIIITVNQVWWHCHFDHIFISITTTHWKNISIRLKNMDKRRFFYFHKFFLSKKIKRPVGITENYLIDINFMHLFTPNFLQCVTHN